MAANTKWCLALRSVLSTSGIWPRLSRLRSSWCRVSLGSVLKSLGYIRVQGTEWDHFKNPRLKRERFSPQILETHTGCTSRQVELISIYLAGEDKSTISRPTYLGGGGGDNSSLPMMCATPQLMNLWLPWCDTGVFLGARKTNVKKWFAHCND